MDGSVGGETLTGSGKSGSFFLRRENLNRDEAFELTPFEENGLEELV